MEEELKKLFAPRLNALRERAKAGEIPPYSDYDQILNEASNWWTIKTGRWLPRKVLLNMIKGEPETMSNSSFRIYYQELGGHTHLRVFSASSPTGQHGKCGDLCMSNKEFRDFRRAVAGAMFNYIEEPKTGQGGEGGEIE